MDLARHSGRNTGFHRGVFHRPLPCQRQGEDRWLGGGIATRGDACKQEQGHCPRGEEGHDSELVGGNQPPMTESGRHAATRSGLPAVHRLMCHRRRAWKRDEGQPCILRAGALMANVPTFSTGVASFSVYRVCLQLLMVLQVREAGVKKSESSATTRPTQLLYHEGTD